MAQVATPSFSPDGGEIAPEGTFTLTTVTSGAAIYYTYGNAAPSPSTWTEYTGAVTLPEEPSTSIQVRAYALKAGSEDSEVETVEFQTKVDTPVLDPASGKVAPADSVDITCATASAAVYFTFGTAAPSAEWDQYATPVPLPAESGKTVQIRAYAVKSPMADSDVAEATLYTVGYSSAVGVDAVAVLDTNATQGLGSVSEGIGLIGNDNVSIDGQRIGAPSTTTDLKFETNVA